MTTMVGKETERLVIVVDIRAWLQHPNPNKLACLLQQSVRTILASMSPSCRWGFKLFDSSMTPFASRCRINKILGIWACTTRFDSVRPGGDNSPSLPEVLSQFCSALNCLHTELHKIISAEGTMTNSLPVFPANASYIASSLMELLSDCIWSPLLSAHEEAAIQSTEECVRLPVQLNSNLVILFSTLPFNHSELAQFFGVDPAVSEADLQTLFSSTFRKVYGSLSASNIHLCWVDVPTNISTVDPERGIVCNDSYRRNPFSVMLSNLGWSLTFLDVLVIGLRMVPFTVLWQGLAHPWFQICCKPVDKVYKVCIQVKDVNNKLLSASLCKVGIISIGNKPIESFIQVKALYISSTVPKRALSCARKHILAQAILRSKAAEKGKLDKFEAMLGDGIDRNPIGDHFFGQIHQHEWCNFEPGKPAWQLLMVHLAREERLAVIDIGSKDPPCFALLEPITVHTALLSIVSKVCFLEPQGSSIKEELAHSSAQILAFNDAIENSRMKPGSSQTCSVEISSQGSQSFLESKDSKCTSTPPQKRKPLTPLLFEHQKSPNVNDQFVKENRSKKAKHSCSLKHEEMSQHPGEIHLEELYTRSKQRSKVTKVLSCWMRQTKENKDAPFFTCDILPAAPAGVCCSTISDSGSDKPLTESELASKVSIDNTNGSLMQSVLFLPDDNQALHLPDDNIGQSHQDTIWPNDPNGEDTKLSTILVPSANDMEKVIQNNLKLSEANAYILSLKQKIVECLSSLEIDLYSFAQRVVLDAEHAFSVVCTKCSSGEDNKQNLPISTLEERVMDRIRGGVLENPKVLASKYKNCRPPKSASQVMDSEFDVNSQMYMSEEKVREYELQILFRMEILSLMSRLSPRLSAVQVLVNEICRLLESIQFNLPGGVLEGESLLDFSNSVIRQRYTQRLPNIVDEIYMAMEFNGHDELSEDEDLELSKVASELIPSGSGAQGSPDTEERLSNSDNPYSSSSQGKVRDQSRRDSSLQRDLFSGRTRCSSLADAADQKLRQAEAKRERAKRFSHFASSCRDMLRVTVTPKVRVGACPKNHHKHHGNGSRSKPHKLKKRSECEVILQTPFSSAKQQTEVLQTPFPSAKQRLEKPPLAAKKKLLVWNW